MSNRNHFKSACRAALFAIAATTVTAQAHASIGNICLELPKGANLLKAQIKSGCLPTSPAYRDAFDITVEPERATISINGEFKPLSEQRIATADCMGSQVINEELQAYGPRRYSVIINGSYRGVIDASDTIFGMRAVRKCFEGPHRVRQLTPLSGTPSYRLRQFKDWMKPEKGSRTDPRLRRGYPTVADLAAALLGSHPGALEGHPSADISISKGQWDGRAFSRPPREVFMAVRIEEHGYLDDSVSGMRHFAAAKKDSETGEWRISFHRIKSCAREAKGRGNGVQNPAARLVVRPSLVFRVAWTPRKN